MTTVPSASDASIRTALARAFGQTSGSLRDFDGVFGYTKNPTANDLIDMYSRQGVAKRIVNAPCDAIWASPPTIKSTDPWLAAWKDLIARFKIFHILNRVDKLSGIGEYSLLVAGFDDGALQTPLNENRQNKLLYLQPYWEGSVTIKAYDEDSTSANFGKPLLYTLDPSKSAKIQLGSDMDVAPKRKKVIVHYSRVLHVAEDTLENDVFGYSRLRAVYNLLQDLTKVTGGASEAFWLIANRGLHINVDKDLKLTDEDHEALADEVEEYANQQTRFIRTRGVTVKSLGSDTPDPMGTFNVILSLISGTTGIPKRILSGAEAGQLASTQDRANWADRIDERRELFADPVMLFPFIKLMTRANVLPDAEIIVKWPEAFKMSPLERAQTSAQSARSATNVASAVEKWEKMKTANRQADLRSKQPITIESDVDEEELDLEDEAGREDKKDTKVGEDADGVKNNATGEDEDVGSEESQQLLEEADMIELAPSLADEGNLIELDEARAIIGFRNDSPIFDEQEDVAQRPTTD